MEILRQYAISIIYAAIIFCVLLNIVQSKTYTALLKFLCGIYFIVILIHPLTGLDWKVDFEISRNISDEGKRTAQAGAELAKDAIAECISEQTKAYIVKQATIRDTVLSVSVEVGDDCIPVSAELMGEVSDEVKEELSQIIASDLGILRENQLWTG